MGCDLHGESRIDEVEFTYVFSVYSIMNLYIPPLLIYFYLLTLYISFSQLLLSNTVSFSLTRLDASFLLKMEVLPLLVN
jgi:hypothetical protein